MVKHGTTCTATCANGGSATIKCMPANRWSQAKDSCQPVAQAQAPSVAPASAADDSAAVAAPDNATGGSDTGAAVQSGTVVGAWLSDAAPYVPEDGSEDTGVAIEPKVTLNPVAAGAWIV